MDKIYSIHDPINPIVCYAESESKQDVINEVAEYRAQLCEESNEYGDFSDTFKLITTNCNNDQTEELVNISWSVDNDGYDHGRFDYLAAVGAV